MRITTKGRYAVTAMLDLAVHEDHGPVPLAEISEAQGISLSYLEQLFAKLRRRGLVRGTRGPHGGYRLARPADEISIAEIITAVDEKLDATRCEQRGDCRGGERCLTHELWMELSERIHDFLDGITLAELVRRPAVRERAAALDLRGGRRRSAA
ncbi:Fe-S cluster assembly transcription factor [Inmirania thermothiophila]|uniref:BadM/Rrf2 family transcriptional regulator n=1 Tax=Inmirania thermothiophila TaxID=1750597 RepID=A0A3N1Y5Q1_9GAMM|nr:Fe-S cluster assembly transcription factor [Inmirania thermothiophila]ROR34146.1 BadM/Rrf2 family transcriptional regulator [Inmirania thermothiophila]